MEKQPYLEISAHEEPQVKIDFLNDLAEAIIEEGYNQSNADYWHLVEGTYNVANQYDYQLDQHLYIMALHFEGYNEYLIESGEKPLGDNDLDIAWRMYQIFYYKENNKHN